MNATQPKLNLFNTLSHKLEVFLPASQDQVRFYSCGPTVYDHAHIGNLRAYIFADTVKRVLEFNGLDVDWVMNITDIDDKTIARTIKKSGPRAGVEDLKNYTDQYFQIFLADLKKINIDEQDISFVKVTEKVADIQLFILELIKKGFAYKADDGSTYFSIAKYQEAFGDYGVLVGGKFLEGKKVGARVKVDEYDKENLSDFALWKAHGEDDAQIFWDHPELGPGRPGWHIECTVINFCEFPTGTDIHTGGIDLVFPHHTNEIAQAQPVYKPFVNNWLHSEHILVDNKKMAKSAGNYFTLADLEKEGTGSGLSLRYLILQSHYRSKLNITKESLAAAKSGLQKLREQIGTLIALPSTKTQIQDTPPHAHFIQEFSDAINQDFNTPEGIAALFKILGSDLTPAEKLVTIFKMDEVLGLDLENTYIKEEEIIQADQLPKEIQELLAERKKAKENKDYAGADILRSQIEAAGFDIIDTPTGTELKLRNS